MSDAALLPHVGDEVGYTAGNGQDVNARVIGRRFYFRTEDPRVELIAEALSPQEGVISVGYSVQTG